MAFRRTAFCAALLLVCPPFGVAADAGLFSADTEATAPRALAKGLLDRDAWLEGGRRGETPGGFAPSAELRSRIAAIDFGQLAAARLEAAQGRPSNLRLNLFADAEFEAVIERTEPTSTGHTLTGRLAGDPLSTVVLAVNGDHIAGTVWSADGMHDIRTPGAGPAVIRQLDPAALRRCEVGETPPAPRPDASPAPWASGSPIAGGSRADAAASASQAAARVKNAAPADDGSLIDVLVVYVASTRILHGGHRAMRALIDRDVAMTNEAYRAGGAAQRIALAGAVEVDWPWPEIDASIPVLEFLEGKGDGYLDEVHALRDLYAADLVVLHTGDLQRRQGGTYGGGIAFGTSSPAGDERLAFSIASSAAFAHELGHGMGLNHERQYDRSNEPFPYSHGYRLEVPCADPDRVVPCEIRTIMVAEFPHMPRFSNPRQKWPDEDGVPLGVPGDEPSDRADGPADAVRHLNEMRRVIANYRASATRCEYALSPELPVLPAEGGEFRVRVETAPGCEWSARSDGGFLSIAGGSGGMGRGEVVYRAPANPGWEREAALLVAAEVYLVRQEGALTVRPVCERAPEVSEAIAAALGKPCAEISGADLASVGSLQVVPRYKETLQSDDFSGLSGLGWLSIYNNDLLWEEKPSLRLEPGLFDGLSRLRYLSLQGNAISALPPGLFKDLHELHTLDLSINQLADLKLGLFDGLANLQDLRLSWNNLSKLQLGVFNGLTNLSSLALWENQLTTLPVGLFYSLSNLLYLNISNNSLTALQPGVFEGLGFLANLHISDNELTTLSPGLFDGVGAFQLWLSLGIADNQLTTLPAGLFDRSPSLRLLYAFGNQLRTLPPDLISGHSVELLHLHENRLTDLPPGLFEGHTRLRRLDLFDNPGAPFPLALELVALPAADSHRDHSSAIAVEVASGVPFDVRAGLSASGGSLSSDSILIEAGQSRSGSVLVTPRGNGPVAVNLDVVSDIPGEWQCISGHTPFEQPCYRGVRTVAGVPLVLNGLPDQTLAGNGAVKFDLPSAFPDFGDGASYAVELGHPAAVEATIRDGLLIVTAIGGGKTAVTVTATDPGGRREMRHFSVTVLWPPEVVDSIPDLSLAVGERIQIEVSDNFRDSDGGLLIYAAESSDPTVASVSVDGGAVGIAGREPGVATVTLTATDPDGLSATLTFRVTVLWPPEVVDSIPDLSLAVGERIQIEVSDNFRDSDGGLLIYAAESSDPTVASVSVDGGAVGVAGREPGVVAVTLTATNPDGLSATLTFRVTVERTANSYWGGWRSVLLKSPPSEDGNQP